MPARCGEFTLGDHPFGNEIPTLPGDLVDRLTFVGLVVYATHARAAPSRARATQRQSVAQPEPAAVPADSKIV